MSSKGVQEETPAETPTLLPSLISLVGCAIAYLKARCDLLRLEGGELAGTLFWGIICFVIAMLLMAGSYVCLLVSIGVFLHFAINDWIVFFAVLGFAHLFFCFIFATLAWRAKIKLSSSIFAATLEELNKDREWLNSLKEKLLKKNN